MKRTIYFLLTAGLVFVTSCSTRKSHWPEFRQEAATVLQQQLESLEADDFDVIANTDQHSGQSPTTLTIKIVNAKKLRTSPDSSAATVRKVARYVVAALSRPDDYQSVQVLVEQQHNASPAEASMLRSYNYSVKALQ